MDKKGGKLNKTAWIVSVLFLFCAAVFFAIMYADAAAKLSKEPVAAPNITTKPPVITMASSAPASTPAPSLPTPTPTTPPEQVLALERKRSRSETESFDLRLNAYAKLLCDAVHTQDEDIVLIEAPIQAGDLSALISKRCYEAGAKAVYIYYQDQTVLNLNMQYLRGEALENFAFSELGIYYAAGKEENLKEIVLLCVDPQQEYAPSDEELDTFYEAQYNYSQKHFGADMEKQTSSPYWTVAAYPTRSWAELVYPELPPKEALDQLWNDLFSFMFIDEDGAISGFNKFNEDLETRQQKLNSLDIRELYYKSSTMDLHIKLHEGNYFEGGAAQIEDADYYFNIPSLELFAMPDKYGANGTLKITRPFCVKGGMDSIVEGLEITIKDGKIVDYSATKGYEYFKEYLENDENNYYLGEVALVSSDTPIFKTGRLFYTTLLDENACCHLAFGDAYEEFNLAAGVEPDENVNESDWHLDIMVGSADLNVTATLADGSTLPILENGIWTVLAD